MIRKKILRLLFAVNFFYALLLFSGFGVFSAIFVCWIWYLNRLVFSFIIYAISNWKCDRDSNSNSNAKKWNDFFCFRLSCRPIIDSEKKKMLYSCSTRVQPIHFEFHICIIILVLLLLLLLHYGQDRRIKNKCALAVRTIICLSMIGWIWCNWNECKR